MPHRIEVGLKDSVADRPGERLAARIAEDLGFRVEAVRTVEVFTIDKELSAKQLDLLGAELFADPITQAFACDSPLTRDFSWLIEVGFKPGVTDNVGRTAARAIEDILKVRFGAGEAVYTSKLYAIGAKRLTREQVDGIARNLLANEMVQRWAIVERKSFAPGQYLSVPRVNIPHRPAVRTIDLSIPDTDLLEISRTRSLALNLDEMHAVRDYFRGPEVSAERKKVGLGRSPTDVEIEVIAQTWSEHCKHKIFNAAIRYRDENGRVTEIDSLFDTYIKGSTKPLQQELGWVVSTLWDNSGVMKFTDDYLFALKCETHNSPSNEEPYGGALTGIVGVYRDPMGTGKGCKLIYGTYGFCTGSPFYDGKLRPKIHPARLLEGVRKGVEDGGNKSGVPTPYGLTFFDDGYMGKPAIFVLAAGLIPAEVNGEPGYEKKVFPGDLIVMCGGRVGIDGIHGATESSLEAGEWISASHVQIGDPFTQKMMHDFLNEARDQGLYRGITDNGAGGLSSSIGEMAQFSGGFDMHLDRVPLKYAGLDPWQILVSESQERMSLAVAPDKIDRLMKLAALHGVEATVLGTFTASGKYHAMYQGKTVAYLGMEFAHGGVPQMHLEAEWTPPEKRGMREPRLGSIADHAAFLKQMLARPNICSKEYIVRQYDHEVQGTSAIKPLVGKESDVYSDAAVLRPVLGAKEGIAISAGINPKYGVIDAYHMTACNLDEAVRRVIAVGGSLKQIALNDNFCWPSPLPAQNNPDAAFKLGQLIRANQALYDYTRAFKTPCISGKDSMSMDGAIKDADGRAHRLSAPETVMFSAAGKIEDVGKCVTMDVKRPGDLVYVLGATRDELGGSEYYEMRGHVGLNVPRVDAQSAISLYNALSEAISKGLVASAHGCYKGGLAVALAQASFAGGYGLEIDLAKVPAEVRRADKILYSESAGRFVVTVLPAKKKRFEQSMAGNICAEVGRVTDGGQLVITGHDGKTLVRKSISELKNAWKGTFGNRT